MNSVAWRSIGLIVVSGAVGVPHGEEARGRPAQEDTGTLRFRVTDDSGEPTACRLLFHVPSGTNYDERHPNLFPDSSQGRNRFALRRNVAYSLSGADELHVPAGEYDVYASKGMEWGIAKERVQVRVGQTVDFNASLAPEIDTTGWTSGDYHLHTLTFSGHGDADLNERIISLIGEGVELAVATDHNHNTDYGPTIRGLNSSAHIQHTVGNEVSTPIGHFNTFPLDSTRPIVEHRLRDANVLFKLIRDEPNAEGIVPVVQVNHPRWGSIDYYGQMNLDAVTGEEFASTWSSAFDSVEVFNETAGWGFHDPVMARVPVNSQSHSVLQDWFNLLNQGHRIAAVGNSDSHSVESNLAGWPRNYVPSSTDVPGDIDVAEIATGIKQGRVFTTFGPFIGFEVNGVGMGGETKANNGEVDVWCKVQAASWIDCDRVKVIVNGEVAKVLSVEDTRSSVRLDRRIRIPMTQDGWVALIVEGDEPLEPVVRHSKRDVMPLAIANPVWVDADGDGRVTPLAAAAREAVTKAVSGDQFVRETMAGESPTMRTLLVSAAVRRDAGFAMPVVIRGLHDADRRVRLAAIRGVARLGDPVLLPELARLWKQTEGDEYTRLCVLKAMAALKDPMLMDRILAYMESDDAVGMSRYAREFNPLIPGNFVTEWQVAAYFQNPDPQAVLTSEYGPEHDATAQAFEGKNGMEVRWQPAFARPNGFLDLRGFGEYDEDHTNAIAYARAWVYAPRDMKVVVTAGSDDGCRLWINDTIVYEEATRRGASPMQFIGRVDLNAGWNRALMKVENGTGDYGLYLRFASDEVVTAASQEAEIEP